MVVNYFIYLVEMVIVSKIIANTTIKIGNIKLIFLIMFLFFVSSGMGVFILNQIAYLAFQLCLRL